MAIGSIAGAVIGGVGSALGGSSSSKAAKNAANAQIQAAQISSNLQRDIYNQNKGILSPYVNSGTNAGNYLNAFLGIGGPVSSAGVTQGDAQNAFSSFLNNSDYAYKSALGGHQVSGNFSGLGSLQSGAALSALQDRQNNINQGYQGSWLGQLAGQQGIGLSAGNALAGVGTNFANAVSANNQSAADANSNAALIAGQNNPWANALSVIGGGLLRG